MLNHGNWLKGTKVSHFLHEALLRVLADSMHKNVHCGAHGRVRVMGLKREVELVFVWSLRNEEWPR